MKLYEIDEEIRALEEFLGREEVDEESFTQALDGLKIEKQSKIANIGLLIKELRADNDVRSEAIKALQASSKAANKRIDWLRGYVAAHLEGPVKTPLVSVSKQKGRLSLKVAEDAQIPETYYRREINKAALTEAVKDGEEYVGVSLERSPDFVVVR